MRKPKQHPLYGMDLVGINFRERWNIVQMATEEEIIEYIKIFNRRKQEAHAYQMGTYNTLYFSSKEFNLSRLRHLRKTWKLRYGKNFSAENLYQVDKRINRWSLKVTPPGKDGQVGTWALRNNRNQYNLQVGTILMYSHSCELGNHYFHQAQKLADPHLIVLKPDDANIGSIVLVGT